MFFPWSWADPKATVFFCFHLEENGDLIYYKVSGTILPSVFALCFMQFHIGCFEILPDHVRLVLATVLVNLMFTFKLGFILKTFPSNTYSCIFFGEMKKPLCLYWADYKFLTRFISACWLVLEQILSTLFSHFITNLFIMIHGHWICEKYGLEDGDKEFKLSPVWY